MMIIRGRSLALWARVGARECIRSDQVRSGHFCCGNRAGVIHGDFETF